MAYYWIVWKLYKVERGEFASQLGEAEGVLPVYRTKRAAQEAHGYTDRLLTKLDTRFPKKGVKGWRGR